MARRTAMRIPGHLRETTLGDVLGQLHRGGASGVLELLEAGCVHRIYLEAGAVIACESPRGLRLSELLLRAGVAAPLLHDTLLRARARGELHGHALQGAGVPVDTVDAALRSQLQGRLAALEALPDAALRFRVAQPRPRGALPPLGKEEFLVGRRRRRVRGGGAPERSSSPWQVLGVPEGADEAAILRAFREKVRETHPDRASDPAEAARRGRALREVLAAYGALRAS